MKKTLLVFLFASFAAAQVQLGKNVQIGSSGAVTSVVPGTNVTCSPNVAGSCVGAVTINSTGGGGIGYSGVNNQTANYAAVIGDAGGYIRMNVASANTFTVPPNSSVAFAIGTTLTIIQVGAGQTTLTAGAGVTINTPTSLSARARWSTIMVTKVATDTWDAAGDLQ